MREERKEIMEALLTTLCYLERDGKYLMLLRNRKKKDINKGKWIGVGGKFEQGESPEECARREVFEETGYCSPPGILPGRSTPATKGSWPGFRRKRSGS